MRVAPCAASMRARTVSAVHGPATGIAARAPWDRFSIARATPGAAVPATPGVAVDGELDAVVVSRRGAGRDVRLGIASGQDRAGGDRDSVLVGVDARGTQGERGPEAAAEVVHLLPLGGIQLGEPLLAVGGDACSGHRMSIRHGTIQACEACCDSSGSSTRRCAASGGPAVSRAPHHAVGKLPAMRAAIWNGPGEMELGEVPDATCPPTACCSASWHADLRHRRPHLLQRRPPDRAGAVLGHEICGEVLEIGPRPTATCAPARPAIWSTSSRRSTAAPARLCRTGNEHLCQAGGLMGFDYQGAYAELVAIPEVALKNVFPIPDGLDDVHATFADPLSDAICGHKDLEIGLDLIVVVIGAGPVGTAHVALARRRARATVHPARDPRPGARSNSRARILDDDRVPLRRHVGPSTPVGAHPRAEDRRRRRARSSSPVRTPGPRSRRWRWPRRAGACSSSAGCRRARRRSTSPRTCCTTARSPLLGSYASRYRDQVQALDMLEQNTANIRGVVTDVVPLEDAPAASADP